MKMAATLFCDQICQQMDYGKLIGAIYLDLTKVFNTIGHNVPTEKLPKFGICGKSLDWFVVYLFNRSQTVEINGCRSVVKLIMLGIPQGSILWLLLFMIFYNDLADHIQSCEVIKYTDDTVIFYANKDPTVVENQLNKDMENAKNYCFTNKLIINTKKVKTDVMLFGASKHLKSSGKKLKWTFSYKQINFVSNYKYLGVITDNTMTINVSFNCRQLLSSTTW